MSSYPRQEGFPADYRIEMPNQQIEGDDQEFEDRRNSQRRRDRNLIICFGILIIVSFAVSSFSLVPLSLLLSFIPNFHWINVMILQKKIKICHVRLVTRK